MAATRPGDGTAAVADGGSAPGSTRPRAATPLLIDGRVAPLAGESVDLEFRILDAALACIARWGVAKTTLDDVAREAGCSRATVYRVVPGGKDGLVEAACERELCRFFGHLGARLDAEPTVAGKLALAIAESTRVLAGHAALGYLIEHEPEVVLPFISFDALDPLLGAAAEFGQVVLGSFLAPDDAREAGEWAARVALSYGFEPDDRLDLTDLEVARRFVRTYVPHLTPAGPPVTDPPPERRTTEKELLHVDH
jgi:AcrR family transcriptional regulator